MVAKMAINTALPGIFKSIDAQSEKAMTVDQNSDYIIRYFDEGSTEQLKENKNGANAAKIAQLKTFLVDRVIVTYRNMPKEMPDGRREFLEHITRLNAYGSDYWNINITQIDDNLKTRFIISHSTKPIEHTTDEEVRDRTETAESGTMDMLLGFISTRKRLEDDGTFTVVKKPQKRVVKKKKARRPVDIRVMQSLYASSATVKEDLRKACLPFRILHGVVSACQMYIRSQPHRTPYMGVAESLIAAVIENGNLGKGRSNATRMTGMLRTICRMSALQAAAYVVLTEASSQRLIDKDDPIQHTRPRNIDEVISSVLSLAAVYKHDIIFAFTLLKKEYNNSDYESIWMALAQHVFGNPPTIKHALDTHAFSRRLLTDNEKEYLGESTTEPNIKSYVDYNFVTVKIPVATGGQACHAIDNLMREQSRPVHLLDHYKAFVTYAVAEKYTIETKADFNGPHGVPAFKTDITEARASEKTLRNSSTPPSSPLRSGSDASNQDAALQNLMAENAAGLMSDPRPMVQPSIHSVTAQGQYIVPEDKRVPSIQNSKVDNMVPLLSSKANEASSTITFTIPTAFLMSYAGNTSHDAVNRALTSVFSRSNLDKYPSKLVEYAGKMCGRPAAVNEMLNRSAFEYLTGSNVLSEERYGDFPEDIESYCETLKLHRNPDEHMYLPLEDPLLVEIHSGSTLYLNEEERSQVFGRDIRSTRMVRLRYDVDFEIADRKRIFAGDSRHKKNGLTHDILIRIPALARAALGTAPVLEPGKTINYPADDIASYKQIRTMHTTQSNSSNINNVNNPASVDEFDESDNLDDVDIEEYNNPKRQKLARDDAPPVSAPRAKKAGAPGLSFVPRKPAQAPAPMEVEVLEPVDL
jgi:hypothetical protein